MKKTISILSLIILSLFVASCTSDNNDIEVNDFKGYYKIKSISSSLPVDLNNDGLQTTDYLQEIKSIYISYNGTEIDYRYDNELRPNFAEARPTKNHNNDTPFLDIQFPTQRIDSIFQGNDNFAMLNMEYTTMHTALIYKLTNDDIAIETDPFDEFEYYGIKNFAITRINKAEFEISFDFSVYDFTENKWIETNLSSHYTKIPE